MHKRIRKELREFFDEPTEAGGPWRSKLWTGEAAVTVSIDDDDLSIWRMTLAGPANTPYAGQPLHLHVSFPPTYPFVPPKVHHDCGTMPFHPNVNLHFIGCCCGPFFCCGSEEWNPTVMTARDLPQQYLTLLAEPNIEGSSREEAAALYQQSSAPGSEYWMRAAASVGRVPAPWTAATHATYPREVRETVCAALFTLRIFERRRARSMDANDASDGRALPDEIMTSILAHVAWDCMASHLPRELAGPAAAGGRPIAAGRSACDLCEEE